MLLLTWHDSTTPAKDFVCDFLAPRSMPQNDSSTPPKDSVCDFVTPRCMPHDMLTPPTDESVNTYTQQLSFEETKSDGDADFGDVAGSGIESSGLSYDESFGVDDLDLNVPNDHVVNESCIHVDVEPAVDVGRTEENVVERVRVDEIVDGSAEKDVIHCSDGEDIKHGNGQCWCNID
nr:hypothetical protein [Tanacetum cinerariifolium]